MCFQGGTLVKPAKHHPSASFAPPSQAEQESGVGLPNRQTPCELKEPSPYLEAASDGNARSEPLGLGTGQPALAFRDRAKEVLLPCRTFFGVPPPKKKRKRRRVVSSWSGLYIYIYIYILSIYSHAHTQHIYILIYTYVCAPICSFIPIHMH